VRPVRGILLVDVSSVGHPKDRDRRAAYTVVEWQGEERSVTQVRVPYDIERTVESLRRSDMPHADEEAEALLQASY
jgi:diadenosine tetraphosphatase ApaH/serine/threonine PP2A family protein phosphatase